MAPLPPPPDLGKLVRKASEEVFKLDSALARKDEGKQYPNRCSFLGV